MPTVAITDTEINPTYVEGHGGGLKTLGPETEGNPTYFGEGGGGWNQLFETEINPSLPAPEVTTDPALLIGLSATPNGTLDSGGGIEPCDCGFEWGETEAYGNTTPTGRKTTGETFSQVITGLDSNKTYHFRAFATGFGTSYGADRTFTTAALVISRAYALAREEL